LYAELSSEDLQPELRKYGEDIDYHTQLLQYCIVTEPDDILDKWFGIPQLRKLARTIGCVVDEDAEKGSLITKILRALNFSVPPPLIGITKTQQELDRVKRKIRFCEQKDICAMTARTFVEVERILTDMLVFYVSFGWDMPDSDVCSVSDILEDKLGVKKPINRLAFGDLVSSLRSLNELISKDLRLRRKYFECFQRDFVVSENQMKVLDGISPTRNMLTHPKFRMPSAEDCDRVLSDMLLLMGEFVNGSIYPVLIRMLESAVNRFSIQYVRGQDEFGGTWIVYTKRSLDPSWNYLMYSRTNPAISPFLCRQLNLAT